MDDQARLGPQEAAKFFSDSVGSRPLPAHALAADPTTWRNKTWQKQADEKSIKPLTDSQFLTGKENGQLLDSLPKSLLERMSYAEILALGQKRFGISCVPCHDATGSGNGMVPRRGFQFPPSYHSDRLRKKPLGYFFLIATEGHEKMPAYGDLVSTEERWAAAAYVRALQFSQRAPKDQLETRDQAQLKEIP